MVLNQETLRFIFGLKLRQYRLKSRLSLKELGQKSNLSPSYINEIEKGKKYPKNDKILQLVASLGIEYEDLISLKLDDGLSSLSKLFEKNILQTIPFEHLGLPTKDIFPLLGENPKQLNVLVGTLMELARSNDINVEDFFAATLRAYLECNDNFFPEIESEALKRQSTFSIDLDDLVAALKENNCHVQEMRFKDKNIALPLSFTSAIKKDGRHLFIEKDLPYRDKIFILSKFLGTYQMGHTTFPESSLAWPDSFDGLLENYKANYFAGSMLIPFESIQQKLKEFFHLTKWDGEGFKRLLDSYQAPASCFFHRLTQILPRFFKIDEIFFLQFDHDLSNDIFEMTHQLHLAGLHTPHSIKKMEHYCRRWVSTSLSQKAVQTPGNDPQVAIQRSKFFGTDNEYLCFSFVIPTRPMVHQVMTLGIKMNQSVTRTIRFAKDPDIPIKEVFVTCERCGITSCQERAAKPVLFGQSQLEQETQRLLQEAELI